MNNFSEKANFIWSIADLIRDTFKRGKYQDVILPLNGKLVWRPAYLEELTLAPVKRASRGDCHSAFYPSRFYVVSIAFLNPQKML